MYIERVIVKNYRALKDVDIKFNSQLNIIVGDNESGKSTLLEAINLALSCQINGRSIHYELHPFLFNIQAVNEFIQKLKNNTLVEPPEILIELYLQNTSELTELKGCNNSLKQDVPGIMLKIEFDDSYRLEYATYIKKPLEICNIPIEYYKVTWCPFSGNSITSRGMPIKPTFIDASTMRHTDGANKHVIDIIKNFLPTEHQVQLSMSYRKMKDAFSEDENVIKINEKLSSSQSNISNKTLTVSLDTTSRSTWESGIVPHLNEIPLPLVGKGEQNSIKIKLAMAAAAGKHIFLIEEPENHLSHTNLNNLIYSISAQSINKQLIITTHSSFVLNKLGVDNVILFCNNRGMTLRELSPETHDYFMKLPGHNTLRLILAKKAILVEGPTDELIVQKAFYQRYKCMPLEKGVDVISVNGLAFERFLEIAKHLNNEVAVITDNDNKLEELDAKYAPYGTSLNINICYDRNTDYPTLEPQLLRSNGLNKLNAILKKSFNDDQKMLDYMINNKSNCALKIFNSQIEIVIPDYIEDAIRE